MMNITLPPSKFGALSKVTVNFKGSPALRTVGTFFNVADP